MGVSQNTYQTHIFAHKPVRIAQDAFEKIKDESRNGKYDLSTIAHLSRVAAAMPFVSFAAGINVQNAAALYIAALHHDLGRLHTRNIGTKEQVITYASSEFTRYMQRRHPHDGFVMLGEMFSAVNDEGSKNIVHHARAQVLGHHTHCNSNFGDHNYPTEEQLALYESTKDLMPFVLSNIKIFGPVLGAVDTIDATGIAPDVERPFRAARLKSEGYTRQPGEHDVLFGTRIANTELVQPQSISIQEIGAVMLDHYDQIMSAI